jgi:hypothetical protein
MKLKKASAWIYNKSKRNIVISELGLTIRRGEIIDLFQRNPNLRYQDYVRSRDEGVLKQKRADLIPLSGPPKQQYVPQPYLKESKEPLKRRTKSGRGIGKEDRDWIELLEDDFPASAVPLSDRDRWDLERQKMIESLGYEDQGDGGEVFADNLFEADESDEF